MSTDHPRLVATKIAFVFSEVSAFGIGVVSGRERRGTEDRLARELCRANSSPIFPQGAISA